jgi:adenylate kinase family enzyme
MTRRILVKGASGAGKSTLARAIAERLALPYVELDALHHGPSWTEASPALLRERVEAVLDDERGWVVDGNYDSKLGRLLLDRADSIVWIDPPLAIKLWQLTTRTARRYVLREELWNGNRETLRGIFVGKEALIRWSIRKHFEHRREFPKAFEGKAVSHLRSRREANAWLAKLSQR